MYNTDALTETDLPASILDFADPEWAGRVGFSPTGADFQAIVSAVLEPRARRRPPRGSRASPRTAPCSTTTWS